MALPALNLLSTFAGIGMLDEAVSLALATLGREARTICYVEREAPAAAIMAARMEEGSLPPAPIWSDLATFDGRRWRGLVDIFTASPPCQPYSIAGKKSGNRDERSFGEGSGPLVHTLRIIEESDPAVVFFENVGAWVAGREQYFRPFGEALSALGYRIEEPLFIAAADIGAPHERERESSSWLTARAEDSESSGFRHSRGQADTLTAVTKTWDTWPTAGANDHKGTAKEGQRRGQLDEMAEQKWLPASESFLQPQAAKSGPLSSKAYRSLVRRLNPAFVNWLQGNVWWWTHPVPTNFGPRVIRWWRYALRLRLSFLLGVLASSKYK